MALIYLSRYRCAYVHTRLHVPVTTSFPYLEVDTAEVFTASRIPGENSIIHLDKCIHCLGTSSRLRARLADSFSSLRIFAKFKSIRRSLHGQLTLAARGSVSLMVNRFATGSIYIQSLCALDKP